MKTDELVAEVRRANRAAGRWRARTLLDAGRYVDALPRSMHEREEWQTVMEVQLSAVEGREPVSLLRIALTLALQESGPTKGHGADETDSPIGNPLPGRDRAEGEGETAESAIRLAIVAQ